MNACDPISFYTRNVMPDLVISLVSGFLLKLPAFPYFLMHQIPAVEANVTVSYPLRVENR